MFNDNYVNLNSKKGIRDLINLDFDFFYNDKLILDLPSKLINDDILYKKLTTKLQSKGFHILFKGITSNTFFGLPNNIMRLLIICSKEKSYYSFDDDIDLIAIPHNHIAPIALLYGKKIDKLEKEYYKIADTLNIPNNNATDDFEKYKIFSELGVNDDVFKKLGIKNNVDKKKFTDGSNKKPSNSKKLRDKIDNADRISMLFPINDDTGKHYYHFNPKRTSCTIREIARINGYSDDCDLSNYNIDDFIFKVNNSLSPFAINTLFDVL